MDSVFIPKQFNTYADTFLMLGIARLLERYLPHRDGSIQICDRHTHFQLKLATPLDLNQLETLPYEHPFLTVRGGKTDWSKMPELDPAVIFDTVAQAEQRKTYRAALYQRKSAKQGTESDPIPPDSRTQNGVFLTSQRCDRNHNGLWLDSWQRQEHYGALMTSLFTALDQPAAQFPSLAITHQYKKITGQSLPKPVGAVKIYLPNAVQGVNRIKADSNKIDSQKIDWLTLWLIANGFFEFAIAERVKIADGVYDWRVVAATPKDISLAYYRSILRTLRSLRPPSGGHGSARFDSELVLKLCQELLEYFTLGQTSTLFSFNLAPPALLGTLQGTHFNSKGQVYGVKELFSLGLPYWIQPQTMEACQEYLTVITEHLQVVQGLKVEEGQSELLLAYRTFITSSDLRQFFPFMVQYADYLVSQLASFDTRRRSNPNARNPALFSISGLNLMVKADVSIMAIVENPSFLRIAKAINQATVYAGKIQTKAGTLELDWQRQYGLAQLLSSQASSKTEFVSAIADFISKYAHENMRLQERYLNTDKVLKRIQVTTDDLNGLINLLETHNTTLVANLLIAYGYARWSTKKDLDSLETSDQESDLDS